jgi:hypothetical protein
MGNKCENHGFFLLWPMGVYCYGLLERQTWPVKLRQSEEVPVE